MYYHASQTANIKVLEPRISNHNIPLIYFSTKRENVLVYLSNAVTTSENVHVDGCEFIEDAYLEIMKAADKGLIRIQKYEDMSDKKIVWIEDIIKREYEEAGEHPEYRHFLKGKFEFV